MLKETGKITTDIYVKELIKALRDIYASNPRDAQASIRTYLQDRLGDVQPKEREYIMDMLIRRFKGIDETLGSVDTEIAGRFIDLLLGDKAADRDINSPELVESLALSLNTVFDMLNQLIQVMQMSLGGGQSSDETIRHVIGGGLSGGDSSKSLEEHLGQIKKAFLASQQASKNAAHTLVQNLLKEFNPAGFEKTSGSALKIGPLKRAESFDLFSQKYSQCLKWFDSGRFMEDFLREFEKQCQKLYGRG